MGGDFHGVIFSVQVRNIPRPGLDFPNSPRFVSPVPGLNTRNRHFRSSWWDVFLCLCIILLEFCWLLCCIVCLLGIAIPGSLSFQCTQDLGGAGFPP